jgi:ElaB/YqjD/DUF883 family membrane-anchored ribosome-binding protein
MRTVVTIGLVAISLIGPAPVAEAQTATSRKARSIATLPAAAQGSTTSARDSVLNGVLIGAAVGAALGLIPDYYDDCEECHDSLYWSIAVGAGVGLVVDALRSRRPASPSGSSPVRVAVGTRRVAVGATLRWR